jgi:hypothetical protein
MRSKLALMGEGGYDVGESWTVRSGWGWRAFFMMALVAIGVAIILAGNGAGTFGILWLVIAAGWFATSMWVWRKHTRYMRGSP